MLYIFIQFVFLHPRSCQDLTSGRSPRGPVESAAWFRRFGSSVGDSAMWARLAWPALTLAALAAVAACRRRARRAACESGRCACGALLRDMDPLTLAQHERSRRHTLNMKLVADGASVVVAESWAEYRRCVTRHVLPNDRTLEVGCGRGVTTAVLAAAAARATGVDASEKVIAMARERYPSVPFEVRCSCDAPRHRRRPHRPRRTVTPEPWAPQVCRAEDISRLRHLAAANGPFNVIFIDINGDRELQTLLPLVEKYEAVLW